jgi:integrase
MARSRGYPFGTLVKLLILTGQRRDEVAGMCRSEIDAKGNLWTLPAVRVKNDKGRDDPLSRASRDALPGPPRIADRDFVLTTTGARRHRAATRRASQGLRNFGITTDSRPRRGLPPSHARGWTRRGNELRIASAETADSADSGHALVISGEAAIGRAVLAHRVIGAPRIVLGVGVRAGPCDAEESCGHEEESLHGGTPFGLLYVQTPNPAVLVRWP